MEGASSSLAGHLDDVLPKEARFVLDWNPPQFTAKQEEQEASPILPPTSMTYTTDIGYSRPAAFYDRHLAPHLILERVVYFDALVSTMANTVDQAIQDAVTKRPLPKDTGALQSEMQIEEQVRFLLGPRIFGENGVTEAYRHASMYFVPLASTLAIHPSSEYWSSIMYWTSDGPMERWASADGMLRISRVVFGNDKWKKRLLQNEDDEKIGIMEKLASRYITLAVWEMKHLTVGTAQTMEEIVEMGLTHAKFPWKKCSTTADCTHHLWEDMEESKKSYDAGFDARSPPWTLPDIPFATTAVDSRPTPLLDGLRSASAQRNTISSSYKEPSLSSVEDDERFSKKRHRNDDSNASNYEQPALKKSKADLMDDKLTGSGKDAATAQLFLQQTWVEAVRNKCTIMVLHSGNHEIIGIRHRETQTLYISQLIKPYSCSNPAYGKIQVGIYISAIQETIDRAKQDIEAREKRRRDPPVDISLKNTEANPDGDLGDNSPAQPTRSNKQDRDLDSKNKHHASGKEIDDQALLANAARQNRVCLRFLYDIYDSPHPAAFRRVLDDGPKKAPGTTEPQTLHSSPGRDTKPLSVSSIHITAHSEMQPGSTGIVHIGTMAVDQSGSTAEVAVKIAFSREEKSQLMEEHQVYTHLHSKGVQGIPRDIGLFVDEEPLLGGEGPYALVMSYAGVSLFGRSKHASDSAKSSLFATLRSIHKANILHGDIRPPNLCVTASGEAFVLDFSHATKSRSRKEKAQEIKVLAFYLGMDLPTEPVVIRRSARIKKLERKSKVKPKKKQVRVKRGKTIRRK